MLLSQLYLLPKKIVINSTVSIINYFLISLHIQIMKYLVHQFLRKKHSDNYRDIHVVTFYIKLCTNNFTRHQLHRLCRESIFRIRNFLKKHEATALIKVLMLPSRYEINWWSPLSTDHSYPMSPYIFRIFL